MTIWPKRGTQDRTKRALAWLAAPWIAVVSACTEPEVISGFPEEFVGVGIELKINGQYPEVVRTLTGGPAADAGLQPGDPILQVDGLSTEGMTLGDVVMKLRGRPQTQVSLTIQRGGQRVIVVAQRRSMRRGPEKDYQAADP